MHKKFLSTLVIVLVILLIGTVCKGKNAVSKITEDGYEVIALYHFEDEDTTKVADSSGNFNDGIAYNGPIKGSTRVEGKKGKAIYFDGVDDYVRLPYSVLSDEYQEGSIEFWVKPEKEGAIFAKSRENRRFEIYFIQYKPDHPDGAIFAWITGAKPEVNLTQPKTKFGTVPLNEWTHVKLVWDKEGWKIFINNILKAVSNPLEWKGGKWDATLGCKIYLEEMEYKSYFKGAIDELVIKVKKPH